MRVELSDYNHLAAGKVREIYEVDASTLLLVASDRISAFDYSLEPAIPDKGRILTATSMFFFDLLGMPNHLAGPIDDARIPDNAGAQPLDQPIVAEGPAAYFSTLPVKAMVQAIRAAGVPAELSHTAGTYVCNHLMYGILHHLRDSHTRAGFVHVPYASEQVAGRADTPSLPLESIVTALTAAIEAIVKNDEDIALIAGTTH